MNLLLIAFHCYLHMLQNMLLTYVSIYLSETFLNWFIENSDDRPKTDSYNLRRSDYQSGLKRVES